MDAEALLAERTQLFANAVAFKHNPRVPLVGNFWTWKYLDAGYNLNEALFDLDILEKVNSEFHEIYGFDAYMDIGTRNQMRVAQALGSRLHYVDESGELLLVDDNVTMEADEYLEYVNDSTTFNWTKYLPRIAKPDLTLGDLKAAVQEFIAFGAYGQRIAQKLLKQYGAMMTLSGNMAFIPMDNFFIALRGMRNLAIDVIKHKDALKEASDIIFETRVKPMLANVMNVDTSGSVGQIGSVFFSHSILNLKQFEELWWPYLKPMIDCAVQNNLRMYIFCESAMLRFAEFFEDIPRGTLLIHVEQDDIFEFRKRLPNIALAGGMSTRLLGYASPKECVDYAKHLIDELGEGFVLSQDKMMSYRNDATRENLLAVNDFVKSYSY